MATAILPWNLFQSAQYLNATASVMILNRNLTSLVSLLAVLATPIAVTPVTAADSYSQSMRPYVVGAYKYVPEMDRRFRDNAAGFSIFSDSRRILHQHLVLASKKQYRRLAAPYKNARLAWHLDDGCWYPHLVAEGDTNVRLPTVNNLAGRRHPCIVVETCWGGFNYWDYSYEIFELTTPKATKIADIKRSQASFDFGDFSRAGRLQASGNDTTFDYWNASRADSPWIDVVIELRQDGWHLCPDIMSRMLVYKRQNFDEMVKEYKTMLAAR
jgi:hypothetical protein